MQHLKGVKINTRNIKLPEMGLGTIGYRFTSKIHLHMMGHERLDCLIIVMQGEG
jgi:hypothetical protein